MAVCHHDCGGMLHDASMHMLIIQVACHGSPAASTLNDDKQGVECVL